MLSRSFRLKKREIDRVYKKGQRFFVDFLLVRSVPNTAKNSRFAVIIPKSVAPKSVSRSRLKRKTTEALVENLALLLRKSDVILSYKKVPDESQIGPTIKRVYKALNKFFMLN